MEEVLSSSLSANSTIRTVELHLADVIIKEVADRTEILPELESALDALVIDL